MTEKAKRPAIRFKGFTEAWEQRKFGEMADYKKGPFGSALKKDLFVPRSSSTVKVYEQQNAINKNWKLERYYITQNYAQKLSAFETHGGDILVSCAGTIGEIYELPSNSEPGIINQALMRVRVNESIVTKKMYKLLFQNMIEDFSKEHSNGSAMKNIPPFADLKPMEAFVPNDKEQILIGDYFEQLDHLITLHQRKYEKLLNIKKSCLEKMFPKNGSNVPEIRFAGFTEAWERRKLSDVITDIADGPFGSNLKTEHYTDEKEARIIQLSNLSDYGWQEENTRYTTFNHAKEIKRCIVNEDELVMGKMMPAGMTIMRPNTEKMYVLSSDCVRIKLDENSITNGFFLYTTKSNSFLNQVNNDSQGSTRVRTSISKIRNMDFMLPTIDEQSKIADYFANLDHLITLHQRKLQMLQNIKKAFLEKMLA